MGWTRNWDNIQANILFGHYLAGATGFVDNSLQLKNVSGTVGDGGDLNNINSTQYDVAYFMALHPSHTAVLQTTAFGSSTVGGHCCLLPGSGTGAESYNDYCITNIPGQAHGNYAYASYPTYSGGVWTYQVTRVLTNNSGSTITVGEIGLFINLYYSYASSNYLIYRKKLDSAFDVANGASYQIVLTAQLPCTSH